MKLLRLLPLWLLLLCVPGELLSMPAQPAEVGSVWLLDLKGVLGPATVDYLNRGIQTAADAEAAAVVIRIDTPGGLDLSMRDLVRTILGSSIPVIGYVTPGGARAASAGTYVLYACHVAAMSPATNLGAATPVQIGAPSLAPPDKAPDSSGAEPSEDTEPSEDAEPSEDVDAGTDKKPRQAPLPGTAMERKIINDAVAYLRGLAELRGRNADWAERAVREGVSLPSSQALEQRVIDLIASDISDLLTQLDGRDVLVNGRNVRLNLAEAPLIELAPDWRSKFLAVITSPTVAYVLLLLGIYGLIFEFSNPGMALPGIVGAICILLALYAFQVLPVSYAGLGLMLLGIALMVAEAFAPSFGVLGLGGLIAFIVGSVMLMDTRLPAFQIALPVILALAASSAALLILLFGMVIRARRQTVVSGTAPLIDAIGVVELVRGDEPRIRIHGELWQADCSEPLQHGDRVRVSGIRGLRLTVTKMRDTP
jgi:membrane-bound serine protease (ClpP class)